MSCLLKNLVFAVFMFNVCSCNNFKVDFKLCEVGSCLRKCCPEGMYLKDRICQETEIQFNFNSINVSPSTPIQDGIIKCSETEGRFLLEKSDNFTVMDNKLQWPSMHLSIPYTHYCVDMIENITTPQALFCYKLAEEESKTHHSTGTFN